MRFDVVDLDDPRAGWALDRYFGELDLRFSGGFSPEDGGAGTDAARLQAPHGSFLVVTEGDEVIGCGGVQRLDETTVEIKRMWIDTAHRGRGLGRSLLGRLEAEARALGARRVVLDTNESLAEAIAMYGRTGYRAIERYNDNPYAHHWFEKRLDALPTDAD